MILKRIILIFTMIVSASTALAQMEEVREGQELPGLIPQGPFVEPLMSLNLRDYDHLDPKRIVPTDILAKAVAFFDANKTKIQNQNYITVIDFRKHSSKQRMWVIEMATGVVGAYWVAHGAGSDLDQDGYAERFSNMNNSHASSIGFYLTGSQYYGRNGQSLRLHGLSSTNSNAYDRAVVLHGSDYVYAGHAGASWGCPAFERKYVADLLPRLDLGSLLYIYGEPK